MMDIMKYAIKTYLEGLYTYQALLATRKDREYSDYNTQVEADKAAAKAFGKAHGAAEILNRFISNILCTMSFDDMTEKQVGYFNWLKELLKRDDLEGTKKSAAYGSPYIGNFLNRLPLYTNGTQYTISGLEDSRIKSDLIGIYEKARRESYDDISKLLTSKNLECLNESPNWIGLDKLKPQIEAISLEERKEVSHMLTEVDSMNWPYQLQGKRDKIQFDSRWVNPGCVTEDYRSLAAEFGIKLDLPHFDFDAPKGRGR